MTISTALPSSSAGIELLAGERRQAARPVHARHSTRAERRTPPHTPAQARAVGTSARDCDRRHRGAPLSVWRWRTAWLSRSQLSDGALETGDRSGSPPDVAAILTPMARRVSVDVDQAARDDPELASRATRSSRASLCACSLRSAIPFLRSLYVDSDDQRPPPCVSERSAVMSPHSSRSPGGTSHRGNARAQHTRPWSYQPQSSGPSGPLQSRRRPARTQRGRVRGCPPVPALLLARRATALDPQSAFSPQWSACGLLL